MNKRKALIGVGLIAATIAGGAAVSPSTRETDTAYLFDYEQKGITIMIPKCGATEDREGCAATKAAALVKAQRKAAVAFYQLSTIDPP